MNDAQDINPEPVKLKGHALAIVALVIGIPIFLLSGLCTGFFSLDLLQGTSADLAVYVTLWEVFVIGAFGYVPAGFLIWAGLRIRKRGTNSVSTFIISITLISFSLFIFWLCAVWFSL